jgi:hypothetical protein
MVVVTNEPHISLQLGTVAYQASLCRECSTRRVLRNLNCKIEKVEALTDLPWATGPLVHIPITNAAL